MSSNPTTESSATRAGRRPQRPDCADGRKIVEGEDGDERCRLPQSSIQTEAESWRGSGQQIGEFTYRTYRDPDRQTIRATGQQIGDFVDTTIR
jgi:hypothetical protein